MQQYFNGTLDAYGVFTDRSGTVVKRFTVVMQCSWKDGQGVLDEDFLYSDGSKQKRIWRLTALGNGRYTGQADDVVGQAQGQTQGQGHARGSSDVSESGSTDWRQQPSEGGWLLDYGL